MSRTCPDVSVIMPAYQAQGTIIEAAASALSGQGVAVELIIAADDTQSYRPMLEQAGLPVESVTELRTPHPRSGPSAARNLALAEARAPVIAALDADDAYAPGRLRAVLEEMARTGLGAGTGPTIEQTRKGDIHRIARAEGAQLTLTEITTLRMPFSPVFERALAPGWPPVGFAEDMVLNAHLCAAAGGYAFAQAAAYAYVIAEGSLVQGAGSLHRALAGYRQILDWLPGGWVDARAHDAIEQVIREDSATARRALAQDAPHWRAAFRGQAD